MQKLLSKFRRAVNDYKMINDGDNISIGLSGGKDSILLLALLAKYRTFSPEKFDIHAITVDMGIKGMDFTPIKEYCDSIGVDYVIEKTDIYEIVFNARNESNPCSLCAKMRRGALNNVAKSFGSNKLALGHNADDILDTFLMSLFYEGRLSTFMPISYMSRMDITLIRPLLYLEETEIKGAVERLNLPIVKSLCPEDKHTEREHIKDMVKMINKEIPIAKDRMLSAILSPDRYNLIDKCMTYKKKADE